MHNKFILSIHWRVLLQEWPRPCLHTQKNFSKLLIFMNYTYKKSTYKKSGYFINLFWWYGSYKNGAIWLDESLLAHISQNQIFPKYGTYAGKQYIA